MGGTYTVVPPSGQTTKLHQYQLIHVKETQWKEAVIEVCQVRKLQSSSRQKKKNTSCNQTTPCRTLKSTLIPNNNVMVHTCLPSEEWYNGHSCDLRRGEERLKNWIKYVTELNCYVYGHVRCTQTGVVDYLGAVHKGKRLVCPSVHTDIPPAALLALYGPPAWNINTNTNYSTFLLLFNSFAVSPHHSPRADLIWDLI